MINNTEVFTMLRFIKNIIYKKKHSPDQLCRDDFISDYFPSSVKASKTTIKPDSMIHHPSKNTSRNRIMSPSIFRRLINLYPPYLGAGIKVNYIKRDWHQVEVRMYLRWYNRNAFGTHFGGNIYSMIDPHLALMLSN